MPLLEEISNTMNRQSLVNIPPSLLQVDKPDLMTGIKYYVENPIITA